MVGRLLQIENKSSKNPLTKINTRYYIYYYYRVKVSQRARRPTQSYQSDGVSYVTAPLPACPLCTLQSNFTKFFIFCNINLTHNTSYNTIRLQLDCRWKKLLVNERFRRKRVSVYGKVTTEGMN